MPMLMPDFGTFSYHVSVNPPFICVGLVQYILALGFTCGPKHCPWLKIVVVSRITIMARSTLPTIVFEFASAVWWLSPTRMNGYRISCLCYLPITWSKLLAMDDKISLIIQNRLLKQRRFSRKKSFETKGILKVYVDAQLSNLWSICPWYEIGLVTMIP